MLGLPGLLCIFIKVINLLLLNYNMGNKIERSRNIWNCTVTDKDKADFNRINKPENNKEY